MVSNTVVVDHRTILGQFCLAFDRLYFYLKSDDAPQLSVAKCLVEIIDFPLGVVTAFEAAC